MIEMISGTMIVIPLDSSLSKLEGLLWEREEEGYDLKSLIQFERHFNVENGVLAIEALAIHQGIKIIPVLREVVGRYHVAFDKSVRTDFSSIYILPGLVVVDNLKNRRFVSEIINHGLEGDFAQNISLDTARMANDHRDQWARRFSNRIGRVVKGTLFGDGVEQDSVFGPEFNRSRTGSIGWYTTSFGSYDKVKVSPRGSVQLWANPPIELFLRFIRSEILPYVT